MNDNCKQSSSAKNSQQHLLHYSHICKISRLLVEIQEQLPVLEFHLSSLQNLPEKQLNSIYLSSLFSIIILQGRNPMGAKGIYIIEKICNTRMPLSQRHSIHVKHRSQKYLQINRKLISFHLSLILCNLDLDIAMNLTFLVSFSGIQS